MSKDKPYDPEKGEAMDEGNPNAELIEDDEPPQAYGSTGPASPGAAYDPYSGDDPQANPKQIKPRKTRKYGKDIDVDGHIHYGGTVISRNPKTGKIERMTVNPPRPDDIVID